MLLHKTISGAVPGTANVDMAGRFEGLFERATLSRFAMDKEDGLDATLEMSDRVDEVLLVAVGRKAVHARHSRVDIIFLAEDTDVLLAFDQSPAQCVACHEADQENRVALILDGALKVMKNSARFTHS